jgi:alpha-tubulin suppressor-like RCC1 family protein
MGCQSGYKFPYDSRTADFDDVFVRKEYFSEGGLWLWGDGVDGSLGKNSLIDFSSPVQTVSGGTNWKQAVSNDTDGTIHTAAIKTDGTLWVWGNGGNGRLGTNDIISRSSPVQTVSGGTNWKQVSVGLGFSAAIKTDGTLWLWGIGANGQIGLSTTINYSSPVQTVSGGSNWKQVSLGCVNSAAIKTDGTLWLWGGGSNGKLGTNTVTDQSSPVQTVSGGTNWKQVSISTFHSAAIKTDGTLWLWGSGPGGRLGDNTETTKSSPVQTISGGNNWKQVSVSEGSSAAIKTDGTLWLWGNGDDGILGNNSVADVSSPVQTVSGGNNWKQVITGGDQAGGQTAAIKTDGTLWMWGIGDNGRLGTNDLISRSSPVQTVSGGTNWKEVSLGRDITLAIREDCW